MQTTKLSSKGQVIIPKILRSRYKWEIGQELTVIDTGDGILLRSARPFNKAELDEVAGVLKHSGKPVSLDEMEKAIKKGALERKK
jgi:AbrB family looped-hinge helix DNA binding protein